MLCKTVFTFTGKHSRSYLFKRVRRSDRNEKVYDGSARIGKQPTGITLYDLCLFKEHKCTNLFQILKVSKIY